MKIKSKSYGEELEIVTIRINQALSITVEAFKVPEGYKSFATNSYIHHDSLVGGATHKDKQESIKMAVQDLRVLMEEYEKNNN
ncbi:MAG: hypothetical protein K6T88_16215 [Bacillus sp. (in: Bacteria)]|nr:hypothetical protein [Bacillus sp. (in: firmicutes)]